MAGRHVRVGLRPNGDRVHGAGRRGWGDQGDQRVEELRLAERLGQKGAEQGGVGLGLAQAERAEQDQRQRRGDVTDGPGEVAPVHLGHVHVEDRQIEGLAGPQPPQRLMRRGGIACERTPLAGLKPQDPPVRVIVVDNQDALSRDLRLLARKTARPGRGQVGRLGPDREMEGRPLAGALALGMHGAAHQFGQPLRDRQPQPGAAIFPGGRAVGLAEGLEQPLHAIG